MNVATSPALWLMEEKLDKARRLRTCLGCGEKQEYLLKDPAPSYVDWYKAHLACRELYSSTDTKQMTDAPPQAENTNIEPAMPTALAGATPSYPTEWDGWNVGDECEARSTAGTGWYDGLVTQAAPKLKVRHIGLKTAFTPFDIRQKADEASAAESLPECPQCGFVGVYLTPTGKCMECAGIPAEEQNGLEERQLRSDQEAAADCDPKIAAFMERTGCTRKEVQAMIDTGRITLRGPAVGTLVTGEKVELLAVEQDNKHVVVCSQSDDPALLAHELNVRRISLKDVRPLNRAGDPCDITTTVGPLFKKGQAAPSQRRKATEKTTEKKAITA